MGAKHEVWFFMFYVSSHILAPSYEPKVYLAFKFSLYPRSDGYHIKLASHQGWTKNTTFSKDNEAPHNYHLSQKYDLILGWVHQWIWIFFSCV